MKSRTITVTVVAAIAVVAVWWLFVFSPTRSDASKASAELSTAKEQERTLDTQNKQLDDLKKHQREIDSDLKRLNKAVPQDAALAPFIDQANAIASATGVTWQSVTPTAPAAPGAGATSGSADAIQLTITVQGPYFNVLDYINRLENIPRLVVADQITLNPGADASGTKTVTATITGRMFTAGAAATAATGTTTTGGATTPTSVAGGGGVAAPGNQNS